MGERELREKYGGKLAKAINRAIRAEILEGNAALDKQTQLAGPAWRSGWTTPSGKPTPESAAYFKHKREVVDRMEAIIRKNWGIPIEEAPARPRREPRQAGSRKAGPRKARPPRRKRQ